MKFDAAPAVTPATEGYALRLFSSRSDAALLAVQ
jgi:hypothetical protein